MKEWSATLEEFLVRLAAEGIDYETELDLSQQEQYLIQRFKRLAAGNPAGTAWEDKQA